MLTAVEVEGSRAGELGNWLYSEHGAVVRAFGGDDMNFLRVSPNLANTEDELNRFAEILEGAPR